MAQRSSSGFSQNDSGDDIDPAILQAIASVDQTSDEAYALSLQFEEISSQQTSTSNGSNKQQFFVEFGDSLAEKDGFVATKSPPNSVSKTKQYEKSLALSDPQWEVIDPTPNIHALFLEFNRRFFWAMLGSVEVGWSKRMTTCAGICYYSGRRSGYCRIGLSEPLLKLRSRKELVETLIHEMIHAYLFITNNNKDHDGHGPEFHKHMYRINGETGLAISVYHTFHDEVAHYKTHWWRCEGPCRDRRPFYGWVKRASNRAPSKNDLWWGEHQRSCGGTFIKVKEPKEYTEKQQKKLERQQNKAAKASGAAKVAGAAKNAPPTVKQDIRSLLKKTTMNSPVPSSSTKTTMNSPVPPSSASPPPEVNYPTPPKVRRISEPVITDRKVEVLEPAAENSSNVVLSDVVLNSGAALRDLIGKNRRLPIVGQSQNTKPNQEVINLIDTDSSSSSVEPVERSVQCPVCAIHVSEASINLHLDSCLSHQ